MKRIERQYIRICACWKLLMRRSIDGATAVNLLRAKHVKNAEQTVSLWLRSKSYTERRFAKVTQ